MALHYDEDNLWVSFRCDLLRQHLHLARASMAHGKTKGEKSTCKVTRSFVNKRSFRRGFVLVACTDSIYVACTLGTLYATRERNFSTLTGLAMQLKRYRILYATNERNFSLTDYVTKTLTVVVNQQKDDSVIVTHGRQM